MWTDINENPLKFKVSKDMEVGRQITNIGCILQALVGAGIPILFLLGLVFHYWKKSRKQSPPVQTGWHGWQGGWHGWHRNDRLGEF